MPYYYKDKSTNKIWSNANIEGAEPIKEAYRYYSMLDTSSTQGQNWTIDSFYIKDGSVPWFNAGYNTTAEINVKYGYMPVMRLCNSSISGKYYIDNSFNYVIPYGMTPMLYKTEIAKGVDSGFSMEHTMVDYSKGGKVSWRMSEQNLRYFNPNTINVYPGPSQENCDTATSSHNFKLQFFGNKQIFKQQAFVFPWSAEPSKPIISPGNVGCFINSKPDYNADYNKFGFSASGPNTETFDNAPANFSLNKNTIPAKYSKLKVKMDALYLYMNGIDLSPIPSYNGSFINNSASFKDDTDTELTSKYEYCQALFYSTDCNPEWHIVNLQPSADFVGNSAIYSNLSKPITNTAALNAGKLVVSNTAEYSVTPIPYNDCTVKEIQELSNINVWNHMILQQVVDNDNLTSTFKRFQFYNKKTGETFNGFIKDGITAVSDKSTLEAIRENHIGDDVNNKRYEEKLWDDTNWNESLPTTTSTYGCFCVRDSTTADFPNYRQLFFNNDTSESGNMCETNFTNTASTAYDKLTSLSSKWLLYSSQTNRNENYYYGHTILAGDIETRLGVKQGDGTFNFDLIYKNSTLDKYKNIIPDLSTEQQYKTTGYTPSAGICYSYTNVKLEHTIDLSSMSGNYLHIAYPFITVFTNTDNNTRGYGLLEQMIMTYEAEK